MFKKLLIAIILGIFISTPSWAGETIKYTVKKGDTLWDISGLKLTDPFLWPKIWKENPQIKNPDLIFPGQTIYIPKDLIQKQVVLPPVKEVKEVAKKEIKRPVIPKPEPLMVISPDVILSSGYIEQDVKKVGTLVSTPSGRTIIGEQDEVYIDVNRDVNVGDKFYTFRSYGMVEHPVIGEPLGELVEITGAIEVTGKEAGYIKARVIKSYSEIEIGSFLDDYYDVRPLEIMKDRQSNVHGTVVAAKDLRYLSGRMDVVYIDKGVTDGLMPGDVLNIISSKGPERPIGKIRVISVRQNTAVALVDYCTEEIVRGDTF